MVDAQIIKEWLEKADEDFEFAVSITAKRSAEHIRNAIKESLKPFSSI